MRTHTKRHAGAPPGFFEAEAAGLDRIRIPGGPPVPAVHEASRDRLVIDHVDTTMPSLEAAVDFGRRLATLHRGGGRAFGADRGGFVATVPLDNTRCDDWSTFYGEQRIRPMLTVARTGGTIDPAGADAVARVIERLPELAGPPESPSLIHGDLWAGNLLWGSDGRVWLIDAAAACDGHRETDLAMLALFGAPYLDDIVRAYDQAFPLAGGWQARVGLHQLHPLLVHAVLFGGGYGARAGAVARRVLESS